MTEQSEFGKGFIYCILLFAMHRERYKDAELRGILPPDSIARMWFNGAGDHFYELEVPPRWKVHTIGKRFKALKERVIIARLDPDVTEKDQEEVFEELKELCILIDRELGLKPIRGEYE